MRRTDAAITKSTDGHRAESLLSRRALLRRTSLAAFGAIAGAELAGCFASAAASTKTILLSRHGARGDGRTDDTAAIQRAVNAAPNGSIVKGERGRVYVVNGAISFPEDHVTLDLDGATIRTGSDRTGAAQASDLIFGISDRRGVQIRNGVIGVPLSPYGGSQVGAKILLWRSSGCGVSRLHADCAGSALVSVTGGGWHRISHNRIRRGSVAGVSCSEVVVARNVIEQSPYNALGFTGYAGGPARSNQFIDNVIRGCGRIGIEDHSPDGPGYNRGTVIRGNRIETPAANASSGTAISAIGTAAVVEGNTIIGATGYAIEADGQGTKVLGNTISWHKPPAVSGSPPAIVINTSTPGAPAAIVSGNRISNAVVAISVFANPHLGGLVVERNRIENPASIGISLSAPSGTFSAPTCTDNEVSFSGPARAGLHSRIGIQTTTATKLLRNRISYGADTYSRHITDVPIEFAGDDVVARKNVIVSHRRTRGNLVCRSLGGSWSGWKLTDNQFLDGAAADLSSLISPVLQGNVGRLTL